MDLVTGQRTFYVGVSGVVDGTVTEIPFRDSASNDIKCNYVRVTCALTGNVADIGGYVAELSGISHEGDMITNTLSALNATSPAASGICGFGGVLARGFSTEDEWHGSNGQVATGIKIQSAMTLVGTPTPSVAYGITYGNLYPLNTLRLEQSYNAGV